MKNEPKKIYIQIGEEPELGFDFNELEGVTHSKTEVYQNDLVYYSESEVLRLIKKHLELAKEKTLLYRDKKEITNMKIDLNL
jgi:hypothetical protein